MQIQYRSGKLIIEGGKFNCTNCKNGARCKRLKMWMKIINSLKQYKQSLHQNVS
jgi:hypothetical protein